MKLLDPQDNEWVSRTMESLLEVSYLFIQVILLCSLLRNYRGELRPHRPGGAFE